MEAGGAIEVVTAREHQGHYDPEGGEMMWFQEPIGVRVDRRSGLVELDRRRPRLILVSRLFFFDEEGFEGEATMLDVSTAGCRGSSVEAVQRGMILKLSLFLPDHHTWPLRTEDAIVRWVVGRQFGLEFTTLRTAQRQRLRALLLEARLDNPVWDPSKRLYPR